LTGFRPDFLWGVATSAAQIEGGADLDGRIDSIWDTFARQPGATRGGHTPRVAADHRRRWRDDVGLLARLEIPAYRFSVAWTRADPSFYDELVDELLAYGIEPVVTLYHWDLPQALEDLGGWTVRETTERFAEHALRFGALLGDRVRHWTTINEPWCAAMLGYAAGVHAPGRRDAAAAIAAAHHLLLAHGLAVPVLREAVRPGAQIGITLNPYPVVAAGDRPEDIDAARRVDGLANRLWYDAVLRGAYPDDVVRDLHSVTDLAFVDDGDLRIIAAPIDALGLNYYRRHHVRYGLGASATGPAAMWPGSPDVELVTPVGKETDGGWAIEPDGLVDALVRVTTDYDPPPLYVHELGAAYADGPDADGEVHDDRRVAFLRDHVDAARAAIDVGVDLRGFFVWSFLDNFEWAQGYDDRFGIVHVDFDTQRRTPKASAAWFSDLLKRARA
jgi:beta-glucosidase